MRITKRQMKRIIREELLREEEERVVFDPEAVDLPIPKKLQKLLDPDLTPQKFAAFDAELDASGSPAHQAFALAAFAMTYADNDVAAAKKLLAKATAGVVQIGKATEGGESKETAAEE